MATLDVNKEDLGRNGIEDMINLLNLTENNLLENIKIRYGNQQIYTYTGSILVAVNPYKMFNIYGLDMVKRYESQVLGTQPPHLFAIGSSAFGKMFKDAENQVVVISGESGAGKTESTKLLMQYLAAVNKSGTNIVTERILQANPLLESFGNAKTIRNDNSSRFGKYVELYFKGGSIVGAKTSEYLLEKSRIVTQAADERNYHVFYEMLVGLTDAQKAKFGLQTPDKYFYLNQGGSCEIPSKNDSKDFTDLTGAMEVLGFSPKEQETIYKLLASVLHIGNIFFTKVQNAHHSEGVEIGSDAEVKWVCHLLQLSEKWLREALTMKVTEARQERLLTPLTIDQALDARDAIAKVLYQRLFSWLVERVNQIVKGPEHRERINSIAILDIFGFEDFHVNSFEQLCINYANESLQYYFNKHIFALEQQEYSRERIKWTSINFHDNQPVIDLIAKKPNGLLHVLDDESNFPQSTDQSFLEKCHFLHTNSDNYEKPRLSASEFLVKHYAGTVTYNVHNFLDKNRDTLRPDVVQLLIQSKTEMISQMFRELRDSVVTKTISKMSGLYVTMKPKTATVAAGFHESLQNLTDTMSKCNPWFVRCIKPNVHKAAMLFEREVVLQQLRYTGMMETIKIRKMGYPVRFRFHTFATRYFMLLKSAPTAASHHDDKDMCERILSSLSAKWKDSWQIGISKLFVKEALGYHLEQERNRVVYKAVIHLQRYTRGYIQRRRFKEQRHAAILVQSAYRGWMMRTRYIKIRQGVILAQAHCRRLQQQRKYQVLLAEAQDRKERAELVRQQMEEEEELRRRQQHESAVMATMETHRPPKQAESFKVSPMRTHTRSVGVASLEIPPELAYIFRKLEGWQPVHSDRNVVNVVGNLEPNDLHLTLPSDINAYALTKYVNIYIQEHPWRLKRDPIKTPFLPKKKKVPTATLR